jgi:hypothetical protein
MDLKAFHPTIPENAESVPGSFASAIMKDTMLVVETDLTCSGFRAEFSSPTSSVDDQFDDYVLLAASFQIAGLDSDAVSNADLTAKLKQHLREGVARDTHVPISSAGIDFERKSAAMPWATFFLRVKATIVCDTMVTATQLKDSLEERSASFLKMLSEQASKVTDLVSLIQVKKNPPQRSSWYLVYTA